MLGHSYLSTHFNQIYIMFDKIRILIIHRIVTALLFVLPLQQLQAETINIPIKADFPLLQQLVEAQLFSGDSLSTELLNDPSKCSEIILSEPKLTEFNQHLKINARLSAKLGVKLLDKCVELLPWDGYIQIISDPVVKSENPRQIHLQVLETLIITEDNEHLSSGALWEKARKYIHPFINQFHMDLSPSIDELKSFLPLYLPEHTSSQLDKMLTSFELKDMQVNTDGIQSNITLEIESIPTKKAPAQPFTEQEQKQWQQKWQSMDALLTHTIKQYATKTDLKHLKLELLDILLDARYQLDDLLKEDYATDPVRHWFINSWSRLIPVLKKISVKSPNHTSLALMSLVTSADALQALDKLGPTIGLDISINGLRRLARMLNHPQSIDLLKYDKTLDPELLRLLQLNSTNNSSFQQPLNFWPINSAIAATKPLDTWIPNTNELDAYLPRVRYLLLKSARQSLKKSSLTLEQKDIFKKIVMATAWQESCWQQYEVKGLKFSPLSSTTGDTGIMQINERVWRGFVDLHKLRWNIAYNAQTGSDILLNYMTRYAIKNAEHRQEGGIDNLARSTYSTYNGGPSQSSRYRNSKAPQALKKIDKVFYEKYLKVKQGKELSVAKCLGHTGKSGIISKPTLQSDKQSVIPTKQSLKKPIASNKTIIHTKSWISKQNKNYFTLQLGVFSSKQAANNFIQRHKVTGNYAVFQNKKNQYVVIYGYYSSHQKAAKEKQLFKQISPWIRSFKDIR